MRVVRYLLISAARFAAGVIGFFVLLLAIAASVCLLAVGLTCAMFTLWAAIHLTIYLTMHDRQAGHHALQAILWAAGCFAVLVVLFSIVGDLFRAARRRREPFTEVDVAFTLQPHSQGHGRF